MQGTAAQPENDVTENIRIERLLSCVFWRLSFAKTRSACDLGILEGFPSRRSWGARSAGVRAPCRPHRRRRVGPAFPRQPGHRESRPSPAARGPPAPASSASHGLDRSNLWIALSRTWARWRSALEIVRPDTVVRWHRDTFRRFWTWRSRRAPGRPPVDRQTRDLVRQMAQAKPLWAAPRINGHQLPVPPQDRVRRRDRRHLRQRLPTELLAQRRQLPPFGVREPQPFRSRPLHQAAVHRRQVLDLVHLMARDPYPRPSRQELKRQWQRACSRRLLTPHGSRCTPPDLLRKALLPHSRRPRFLDGFPRSDFGSRCRSRPPSCSRCKSTRGPGPPVLTRFELRQRVTARSAARTTARATGEPASARASGGDDR